MRKILIISLALLPLVAFQQGSPSPVEVDRAAGKDSDKGNGQCSIDNKAFQDGEEIVFKIFYNWNFVWLSAGEAVFRVKDLGHQYHISVHGTTYPSYEWFFKVDDHYDAYVDKETLLPYVSVRDVQEGKYTVYDKVTYDQEAGVAVSLRGKTKEDAETTSYDIEPCMHDILSIVYYCRNLEFDDMDKGDEMPVRIFMDKEVWPLKLTYLGKEKKKRIKGRGKFDTIKFSPDLVEGHYFNAGDRMEVWVTDDANRLPVLIESPVSVGSVKAVLKSWSGLKHELEAKR